MKTECPKCFYWHDDSIIHVSDITGKPSQLEMLFGSLKFNKVPFIMFEDFKHLKCPKCKHIFKIGDKLC